MSLSCVRFRHNAKQERSFWVPMWKGCAATGQLMVWDDCLFQDNFVFLSYRNTNRGRKEFTERSVNLEHLHMVSSCYCRYYTHLSYSRKCSLLFPCVVFLDLLSSGCWIIDSFHEQNNKGWSAKALTLSRCFIFLLSQLLRAWVCIRHVRSWAECALCLGCLLSFGWPLCSKNCLFG